MITSPLEGERTQSSSLPPEVGGALFLRIHENARYGRFAKSPYRGARRKRRGVLTCSQWPVRARVKSSVPRYSGCSSHCTPKAGRWQADEGASLWWKTLACAPRVIVAFPHRGRRVSPDVGRPDMCYNRIVWPLLPRAGRHRNWPKEDYGKGG